VALGALVALVAFTSSATAVEAPETVVFHVALSGPPDPDGQGVAVLRFNPDASELCYQIVVRNIGAPTEPAPGLGPAHIHYVAGGGIAVPQDAEFAQAGQADVYFASNCVPVDPAVLQAILVSPSSFYVNIHTVAFPGGAISGLLG
jgi:hypothetical protein